MVIDGAGQRVAECGLGRKSLVLQAKLQLSHGRLVVVLVLINGGEVEVNELHHRLQILGHRPATEVLVFAAKADTYACLLAKKSFLQLLVGEVAQSASTNNRIEVLQVDVVRIAVEALATTRHGLELNLVLLEVSLLQDDTGTIGERQLLVTKGSVILLADNLASLRQLGLINERLILHIVHIRLHLLGTSLLHGLSHLLFCRIGLAILLLGIDADNEIGVRLRNEILHIAVEHIHVNHRSDALHDGILILNRRDRLVGEIVVAIVISIGRVGNLVALVIHLVKA